MSKSKAELCQDKYFNTFYITHIKDATNFAFYKCGNNAVALDLAQEAFTKIWENCAKIEIGKAKSYLLTVVNNLFLNTKRHEKVVFKYAKDSPYHDHTNKNPEYLLEEKEFKLKLTNAISSLSDNEREVFLLNRMEEKKYREIADLLNISQKTVEKRMSNALKDLRAKLGDLKF